MVDFLEGSADAGDFGAGGAEDVEHAELWERGMRTYSFKFLSE